MATPMLTLAQLWKRMSTEQRLRAARALWNEAEARTEQIQATGAIAQHFKFRTKTVAGLDQDRRAHYLASVAALSDDLAAKLLVLYHLAEQKSMMSAFLDAIGIAHRDGLIGEDAGAPDPARVAGAATAIAERYPAQDVAIYLNTLLWQDPGTWGMLAEIPERRLE